MDRALPFHHKAHRHTLHAPGGKSVADLAPEEWREFVTHEPVKHAPGLLCVHEVDVERARMFERLHDGILRDLVECDALVRLCRHGRVAFPCRFFAIKLKRAHEVPRDRFSFAVLVGCKNDLVRFLCERLQIGYDGLGFLGDRIAGREVVSDINADLTLGKVADVAI